MQKFHTTRRMRHAGFTIMELLVVIGLMAALGTISVTGYFAASNGMKTRGAVQDSISFLRNAAQVSLIEQKPVAVLFYNQYTGKNADGGEAYGTALAIKSVGRISLITTMGTLATGGGSVSGGVLFDEYADWDTSYPRDKDNTSSGEGIRFYRMTNIKSTAKGGQKSCSTLMNNFTVYAKMGNLDTDVLLNAGMTTEEWCTIYKKKDTDNMSTWKLSYHNGNDFRWGLGISPANDGLGQSNWRIGDAYGTEFDHFELPRNFIFGNSLPSDDGKKQPASVAAIVFIPSEITGANSYQFSMSTLPISAVRQVGGSDTVTKVGEVRSSDMKDSK